MKLYVCYGTWRAAPWRSTGRHPCGEAYRALRDAGHSPDVKRAYGLGGLPGFLNDLTPGRREGKQLTGSYWVPVLVTDEGTVIQGSGQIVEWARAHPAAAPSAAG